MYAPIKVRLASELSRRELAPQQRVTSILRKPVVVQAAVQAIVPASITATSAMSGTVIAPPSPAQAQIWTSFATRRHSAHSRLKAPAAITGIVATVAPVVTTPRVSLVAVRSRQDWRRRKVQAVLRPPTVLSTPVSVISPDQLVIRTKIAPQPRRLPARIAWINPAVINPIVLGRDQITTKITLVAVDVRHDYKRRLVKRVIRTSGQLQLVPAVLTSTSTVTGAVSVLSPVVPVSMASTSSVVGNVSALRQLQAAMSATSVLSANVSGGTGGAATVNDNRADGWISYYYG